MQIWKRWNIICRLPWNIGKSNISKSKLKLKKKDKCFSWIFPKTRATFVRRIFNGIFNFVWVEGKIALYLCKSITWPCMECCCNAWTGTPSWFLELLDTLQKRIYSTVGASLAASLEPLAHLRNVSSLSLFYSYYFGRCLFELSQVVPLSWSRGRFTRYSDRLNDFSVTIPKF